MYHTPAVNRPPNRLARETSPYLQQHARNPVDWYPWGDEAFAKARAENKPIFLSVGYSACHWCHVMERESFENEEIARLLNEHYVSIKVDREERPDVDQIYMSAVQLITRRGGWPMSVFLTPDAKPFYGGTYWPPTSRLGMPGFRDILVKLHDYWVNRRDEVDSSANDLVAAIGQMAAPVFERAHLGTETLRQAMQALIASADRVHGGFGGAPKFPHPMDLRLLLRCWKRFGNEDALQVALLTLNKMARGGIYDHLGGGFHRYSTDARWLVPHFEKMLYDNALLVPAYLEAWQASGDPFYAGVVHETLAYVLREMTSPEGSFYSTQDADSEGEEGRFFVWTESEIAALLSAEEARIFNYCYDVTPGGNWEGQTILNRPKPAKEAARVLNIPPDDLEDILARCREKLFVARARRVSPGRDEKILTAWNGMMITALASAALVLRQDEYAQAAIRAANFILTRLRDAHGRLLHSYKDGRADLNAYLDDYACLIDGLTTLFEATADERWLTAALELAEDVMARFPDTSHGGFFYTSADHEALIARTKDAQDSATPSGNGMLATAMLKLSRLTDRSDLEQAAAGTLEALSGLLEESPRAAGQALLALDFLLGPTCEIVVIDAADELAASLKEQVWKRFLPNKVAVAWPVDQVPTVAAPLLTGKRDELRTGLFLCQRGECRLPAYDEPAATLQLSSL